MPTIGIDLGTTNSLVAYWTDEGPRLIPNVLGSNLTPSVVSVDENGEIYVGQIAKERKITHPHLTASSFKRFMGTEKVFHLGQYSFTPEDLSSFVVRSLKADAEAYFGSEVTEAVISVPAYFNDVQRKATKRSAELAGLKVERLVSEPTAAAISYGLHQKESETSFLVFDLGGGTFDVSILELFEGVMQVKSIAGDNFLGGEDFTDTLAAYFIERHGLSLDSLDFKARSFISKQAEQCKCELSNGNKGKMAFTINDKTYESVIDREEYEKLVQVLLIRLRHPIERALRDAELMPEDLDSVILIGGATRMHVVRSVVSKMLGRLPNSSINPDEAVALGTAIQVALKERNQALNEVILTDVCPYSLGTNIAKDMGGGKYETGYFLPIIERNTPIPVSKVETLSTLYDNQSELHVEVYQGESRRVEGNIKIGELNIPLNPERTGKQLVDVRYTYDINGILEVEVLTHKTGLKNRLVIEKSPGSMTQEEIEERLNQLKGLKIHPRERTENKLLIARGERLYEEALGEMREYISMILQDFESIMSRQNELEIRKAAEILKKKLDEIEMRF
ncbi:molecular chaperone HscC [Pseudobacteroides cellulosolvens]|uniref:Chaperone protein DnaK n=1 Tax=Pseudobacteroides cellulosolvens ATCC 35603 = DSM 2933 TaxID=398512 RepID=A0A0L6JX61_9FIRM|nr:molecular chaperone HscC [Pseudobacteroides cellulosolvens]KNY30319.1 Heat shock protein 70 [Pseudobacteroides cellulosolvens ATCC 35603 = DSM 2933]